MNEIFISYSRKDIDFVNHLVQQLDQAGYDPWFDFSDIPYGTDWSAEIGKGICNCKVFVLVVSPNSMASENVRDEIGTADYNEKPILPLMLQQVKYPPEVQIILAKLQYIDFQIDFQDGFQRLLKAIGKEDLSPKPLQTAVQPAVPPQSAPQAAPQTAPQAPQQPFTPAGVWSMQLQYPNGAVAQGQVTLYPNGTFQGQIVPDPYNRITMQGNWLFYPPARLDMQGMSSLGTPWWVSVIFHQITPQALNGRANDGTLMSWQRIG